MNTHAVHMRHIPYTCNHSLLFLGQPAQVHGGGGVSQDFVLAHLWAGARTLRIADGPDEVHLGTLAKLELGKLSSKL